MSDRDAPAPDRVVETALRLLPVPDHEPGFWEHNGYHDRGDPWLEQRYRGD